MDRRICNLIGVAVLALCASGYGAADDAALMIKNADACVSQQKFDRAQALYERAESEGVHFETDLPHARNLAAVYLYSTPPDLAKAIKWLQITVTLDPQSDNLRTQLANAFYRSGNLEAAIDQYRILVEAHPTSTEYVLPLGTALRRAGKSDAALQLLQASTERFPNLVAFRIEYARQLNFTKQFPEARKQFSAVLAIEPQNLIAQVGLAKATSYEGDQETAIEMYGRILQRHPGSYDAIVGKAFSLLWSGRTEQAGALLRQASVRDPEDREVREALSSLPRSAAAAMSAAPGDAPEDRERRQESPRRATQHRAPNFEKPESKAATSPAPVALSLPEPAREQIPEQNPQHRDQPTGAMIGLGLLVVSFAYGRLRSRHLRGQEKETESLPGVRAPRAAVSMVEQNFRNRSIARESGPDSNAAAEAIAEAPRENRIALADACEKHTDEAVEQEVQQPSHPHSRQRESHQPLPASLESEDEPRLKVLLVGGRPHEVELEKRWFPFAANEMIWEHSWAAAVAMLASAPPDLIVLNSLSEDGRTSKQMFGWILANIAELRDRTIVVCGRTDANRREPDCHDAYLIEPFSASQWKQAVISAARRQPRLPVQRVSELRPDLPVPAIVLTHPSRNLPATNVESAVHGIASHVLVESSKTGHAPRLQQLRD